MNGGSGRSRDGVRRWKVLEHLGVRFPPPYEPHGGSVRWRGATRVKLSPEAEEYATAFARIEARDVALPPRFRSNFWGDWSRLLPAGGPITSLDGCSFAGLLSAASKKRAAPKEKRAADAEDERSYAVVDGVRQPVSGVVEAGSVFLGRGGLHPMAGRIKRRITPADVTLNLGKGAKVPPGAWAAVVHDPFVDWLARWRDPLLGMVKYVRLSPAAGLEQDTNRAKFERARAFHAALPAIVSRSVRSDLNASVDPKRSQLATCFWLLVRTALRVGSPSESRVVGLTTMTTEHVRLTSGGLLAFDFLGKDSVPYRRSLVVDDPAVLRNLRKLLPPPGTHRSAFPLVSSVELNEYLGRLMKGLTAKDIRTARASAEFEAAVDRVFDVDGDVRWANLAVLLANVRVAFLCNHRKMVTTGDVEGGDARLAELIDGLEARAVGRAEAAKALEREAKVLVKRSGLALGTSRANYIDPRIAVSFAARAGLLPAAALRLALPGAALAAKFSWASMEGDAEFRWSLPAQPKHGLRRAEH